MKNNLILIIGLIPFSIYSPDKPLPCDAKV